MKRILLVLSVALVMAAMIAATALPAMAQVYYDVYYYCEWDYLGNYECIYWY